jgi:hypothetical protein
MPRKARSRSSVAELFVRLLMFGKGFARLLASACGALMLLATLEVHAQSPYPAQAVKSAFAYRMTGYVEWPPAALQGEYFTFAVVGAGRIADELERLLLNQTIKNLPVRIQRASSIDTQSDAQVLVVGAHYKGNLRRDIARLGSRPVLIITDLPDGLEQGSMVNFISIDRRVRFEISLDAARRAGLGIGSELLSVAARVRGTAKQGESACIEDDLCGKTRKPGEMHVGQ